MKDEVLKKLDECLAENRIRLKTRTDKEFMAGFLTGVEHAKKIMQELFDLEVNQERKRNKEE